jgi:hypothetical protein
MHVGPLQQGLCAQTEGLLYTALHGVDLTHRDNLNEAGVQGTSVLTRGFAFSKSQALLHEFINGSSSVTLQENVYFVPRDDNPHKEMESVANLPCKDDDQRHEIEKH